MLQPANPPRWNQHGYMHWLFAVKLWVNMISFSAGPAPNRKTAGRLNITCVPAMIMCFCRGLDRRIASLPPHRNLYVDKSLLLWQRNVVL